LTSTEIRANRALLTMTQQQFADHLGTGVASVKRWEAGQIQDKAMDELIRLKTDPETARRNLRNLEEQIPEPFILFDGEDVSLTMTTSERRYSERRPAMIMETVSGTDKEEFVADACIAA
jgi:transcriptional regulator with XRE-family HTH domain